MVGISQLAKQTNIKITTIRYYEEIGLISSPPRSMGNHRQYTIEHLTRLKFIKHCRELGFSQKEIKELLGLNDNVNPSCHEVNMMTLRHLDAVKQKISNLRKIKKVLDNLSASCADGKSTECPIINSLYKG